MSNVLRYAGQAAAYGLFALIIGTFADSPAYTSFPPDAAMVKVSFRHTSERKEPCARLSAEEIARRAATNMRKTMSCPRGRVPVRLEVRIDGEVAYADAIEPSGLFGDGAVSVYHRFPAGPGEHRVRAAMRDSRRESGFDHVHEETVSLTAGRILLIEFEPERGGFRFR